MSEVSDAVKAAAALDGEWGEWLEAKQIDREELITSAEASAAATALVGTESSRSTRNVLLGFVIGYTLAERRGEPS